MNENLSKSTYYSLIFFIIVLSVCIRAYFISVTKYAPNDSYSSHLKTSLNYIWSLDEFRSSDGSKWYKKQELFDAFFKLNSPFNYTQLYSELARSNHPPLYYYLLHTFQSLKSNGRPFFIGAYVLNLLTFAISILLFIRMLRRFSVGEKATLLGALWFSLSFSFIQNALSHKAYELQLLFSIALVLLVYEHSMKDTLKWSDYVWYGFFCCILYLLHYFSFLFIFMIGAVILIYYVSIKMHIQRVIYYGVTTFASALIVIMTFPFMLDHLMGDGKSKSISTDLKTGAFFDIDRIVDTLWTLNQKLLPVYLLLAIIVIALIYRTDVLKNCREKSGKFLLILCSSSILFALVTLVISPSVKLRYAIVFLPYFILISIYVLSVPMAKSRVVYIGVISIVVGWAAIGLFYSDLSKKLQTYRDKELYPSPDLRIERAVFVSRFNEPMRTYVFNNPFEEFALVHHNFDPSLLDDLSNITFIINEKGRAKRHKEVMHYLMSQGFVQYFESRRSYIFFKLP